MIEYKALLEAVKMAIIGKGIVVYREELTFNSKSGNIEFTVKGFKECMNQSGISDYYYIKMKLIEDTDRLLELLRTAEYINYTDYQTHPKPHVLGYHYLKTVVDNVDLYFNIQLTVQKQLILHSITASIK